MYMYVCHQWTAGITTHHWSRVCSFKISIALASIIISRSYWTCSSPTYRVSNQISDTTYNQTPVSREWKELWSPFLRWLVALVKCWLHIKSNVFAINNVWARDKNVHPSDLSNYQTFVPNFRQSLPSLIKLKGGVPDLDYMTIYPCYYWPPNFSLQCFCNWMWQGFK